jgi:hypothetical protein
LGRSVASRARRSAWGAVVLWPAEPLSARAPPVASPFFAWSEALASARTAGRGHFSADRALSSAVGVRITRVTGAAPFGSRSVRGRRRPVADRVLAHLRPNAMGDGRTALLDRRGPGYGLHRHTLLPCRRTVHVDRIRRRGSLGGRGTAGDCENKVERTHSGIQHSGPIAALAHFSCPGGLRRWRDPYRKSPPGLALALARSS